MTLKTANGAGALRPATARRRADHESRRDQAARPERGIDWVVYADSRLRDFRRALGPSGRLQAGANNRMEVPNG